MIPSKTEWSNWGAIEKVGYIAQMLAPFSLLITVIFSFLAWSESRKSTELQIMLFQAQNSPDIVLEKPYIAQPENSPILIVPLKNVGSSVANNICVNLNDDRTLEAFNSSCEKERPFVNLSLNRDQQFSIPIASAVNLKSRYGFLPKEAHIIDIGKETGGCKPEAFSTLLLTMYYEDALGGVKTKIHNLMLCG